jgi:hypothetical protein
MDSKLNIDQIEPLISTPGIEIEELICGFLFRFVDSEADLPGIFRNT